MKSHGIEDEETPKDGPEVIRRRTRVRSRVEGVVGGVTGPERPKREKSAGRWPDLDIELCRLGFNSARPEKFERSAMEGGGSVRPAWGTKKHKAVGGPGPEDLDYGNTGTDK